jgi:hypothetical protein
MGKLNWLQKRSTKIDGEMNLEELSEIWKSKM